MVEKNTKESRKVRGRVAREKRESTCRGSTEGATVVTAAILQELKKSADSDLLRGSALELGTGDIRGSAS